ncbi:hypothetical protein Syun_024346 [Stephania yunnanensis]|uniref:Uncharacterized protein n=1 Tax=Stephania yunnanensis TaxID=152371 RepID=A0AAP0I473_9MAGN
MNSQTLVALVQSLRACRVVSAPRLHSGHKSSSPIPRLNHNAFVGSLSWSASHKSVLIRCGPSHFHRFVQ